MHLMTTAVARALAAGTTLVALLACSGLYARAGEDIPVGELTGGATTVYANGRNAFSFPFATLSDEERARFAIGNSFFKRNWVQSPASTTARDGLGPHFLARSCGGCHAMDGRARPPPWGETLGDRPQDTVGLLLRASVAGLADAHAGVKPEPTYGTQINNASIQGVRPEARVRIASKTRRGQFSDGTAYTLRQPFYSLDELAYGPLAVNVLLSPRIAPQLAGVGLLEAISAQDIEANAAAQAKRSDAIKGRVNRVWDAVAQTTSIGRFGWKANVASLAHQTAGAFNGDIGITSRYFPKEACGNAQADCLAHAGSGNGNGNDNDSTVTSNSRPTDFEIDEETLDLVVFYQATLAPAAKRNVGDAQALTGQVLFQQANCVACHTPSYTTTASAFPRLSSPSASGQVIWPYTDLLLHDMGDGLADHRPDFLATGKQWKTPPLWGIGLIQGVNGHQRLLHDGRANGVMEAILWHGGEAAQSTQAVKAMSQDQRDALVKFVNSL
jgi:CxxC motif-containing protein (DUF1111 family)